MDRRRGVSEVSSESARSRRTNALTPGKQTLELADVTRIEESRERAPSRICLLINYSQNEQPCTRLTSITPFLQFLLRPVSFLIIVLVKIGLCFPTGDLLSSPTDPLSKHNINKRLHLTTELQLFHSTARRCRNQIPPYCTTGNAGF